MRVKHMAGGGSRQRRQRGGSNGQLGLPAREEQCILRGPSAVGKAHFFTLNVYAQVARLLLVVRFVMLCACFLPTCNACNGGGSPAGRPELQAVAPAPAPAAPVYPCACFLQTCQQCNPGEAAASSGAEQEASSGTEPETSSDTEHDEVVSLGQSGSGGRGKVLEGLAGINAAGPECACFMPSCGKCSKVTPACQAPTPGRHDPGQPPSKRRRKRRLALPPGHSRCSLGEELEIDARIHQASPGHRATHAARYAVLAAAVLFVVQPSLIALEMIGRPRGERCDFFEVYAGCANFTAAVVALGMLAGPAVDILHKSGSLRLDCLLENSQALLQAVLAEARPRWLHVGPPCTFWTAIGRWTCHGTPEQWSAKRVEARSHWGFALHLLTLQVTRGDKGSLEQPPRCVSLKLGMTQDFRQAHPAWKLYTFRSCPYGMKNPGTGEPWEKLQGFLCNASLDSMQQPCVCTVPHGHVKGVVKSGPRRGERCSTVSGEYPPRMCSALAAIVKSNVHSR